MEEQVYRQACGIGSGRLGIALAFLAWALSAAVPAFGQGADADPLPPLPPIDPNEEPPLDWEAWREVPKLLGVSQADLTSTYSYSSDTSRERRSGEYHTTVFMELRRLGIEETGPTRSFQWLVTSATGFGSEMSTYSDYYLSGGFWVGGGGDDRGKLHRAAEPAGGTDPELPHAGRHGRVLDARRNARP